MLIQYVKHPKTGKKIGVVVALPTFNENCKEEISMGWSLCRKCDVFNKKFGRDVAKSRADNDIKHLMKRATMQSFSIRPELRCTFKDVYKRASKYYKGFPMSSASTQRFAACQ